MTISRNGNEIKKRSLNQRIGSGKTPLGSFEFSKGDSVVVTVSNAGTKGHVVVDAVQFLPKE